MHECKRKGWIHSVHLSEVSSFVNNPVQNMPNNQYGQNFTSPHGNYLDVSTIGDVGSE